MTIEELLVEKWRSLPPERQQEVVDFVEFLKTRHPMTMPSMVRETKASAKEIQPISELGKQLQQIRAEIIASGTPLLTDEEIEWEVAERRSGYQGN